MRIALAQLWQETNTFNPVLTTRSDFELFGLLRGQDVLDKMANTNELGGMIQSLAAWNPRPEMVGLVRLPAWPSGLATSATFDWIQDEVVQSIERAMPFDALLFALHGAMVADGHPDVEGEILELVRGIVGPKVPIVGTLDLHAHLTERMVRNADALVLYHTVPHIDVMDTGRHGAEVMRRILYDGARPVSSLVKIPMVVPAERANTEATGTFSAELKARLKELESRPEVLAAGVATVQPWLDIPGLGASVLIVTDNDPELAKSAATEIAESLWQNREQYLPELTPIEDAVRRAYETTDGLAVLSDSADATTSGAPGDSVWLLEEILKYQWPRTVLTAMVAPDVVEMAERLGAGSMIMTDLGGVRDTRFGKTITFAGEVERIFEGRFTVSGHLGTNMAFDMGRCVVLRKGNVRVVVTERSGPHFSPELFRTAGFDPFAAQVVVARSPCGFRAAYASRAKLVLSVKAPGCAPSDFWNYPYRNITHPTWPWDTIDSWKPHAIVVSR